MIVDYTELPPQLSCSQKQSNLQPLFPKHHSSRVDMAYCWNHVRITCELGSIPTVGIGGQVAWFPYFVCRLALPTQLGSSQIGPFRVPPLSIHFSSTPSRIHFYPFFFLWHPLVTLLLTSVCLSRGSFC